MPPTTADDSSATSGRTGLSAPPVESPAAPPTPSPTADGAPAPPGGSQAAPPTAEAAPPRLGRLRAGVYLSIGVIALLASLVALLWYLEESRLYVFTDNA